MSLEKTAAINYDVNTTYVKVTDTFKARKRLKELLHKGLFY